MKNILLFIIVFGVYRTGAQAPSTQILLDRYPTNSQNYRLQLPDSVSSSQITSNVCDDLNGAFAEYPLYGLTEQFTNQSTVIGGSISGWVWYFGDGTVTKDTINPNPAHTYASAGNYNVCLVVYEYVSGSGVTCQDSVCNMVTISFVAGVQDLSDEAITIYPNPSKGDLMVRANIPMESYSIYNMEGEKVEEQKATDDVIHLPPTMTNGIYFIYFKTSSTTLVKKLLLQYQ